MKIRNFFKLLLLIVLCLSVSPACAWRGNGWNTGATHLNYKGGQFFYSKDSDAWISSKPIIFVEPTVMKNIILPIGSNTTPVTVGDSQAYFVVPPEIAGMSLLSVGAHVYTASSSGTPTFQIRKKKIEDDTEVDLLATPISIDPSERDSSTASTQSVITSSTSTVATGDEIYLDVDSSGTDTAARKYDWGSAYEIFSIFVW